MSPGNSAPSGHTSFSSMPGAFSNFGSSSAAGAPRRTSVSRSAGATRSSRAMLANSPLSRPRISRIASLCLSQSAKRAMRPVTIGYGVVGDVTVPSAAGQASLLALQATAAIAPDQDRPGLKANLSARGTANRKKPPADEDARYRTMRNTIVHRSEFETFAMLQIRSGAVLRLLRLAGYAEGSPWFVTGQRRIGGRRVGSRARPRGRTAR